MAGKRTEMSKIKQILLLHKDGMSNRKIGGTAWSLQGNGEQICQCGEVGQQDSKDGRARTPAPFQCRKCRLLGQAL